MRTSSVGPSYQHNSFAANTDPQNDKPKHKKDESGTGNKPADDSGGGTGGNWNSNFGNRNIDGVMKALGIK